MFGKSKKECTSIGISATDYINFNTIDNRIKQDREWSERFPMSTRIIIPTKNKKEIIEKLKKHNDITSIDGELTAKGIEVSDSMPSIKLSK